MRFFILITFLISSINTVLAQEKSSDPQLNMSDPIEPVNRAIWYFNYDILDSYIFKPTTEFYVDWIWDDGRRGINNFVLNFEEPSNVVNNLIQLEFKHSADALVRFVINSTVGLLGFIDVAKMGGFERRRETFSNVLGRWHVPNGPYLMVPVIGPRSTRKLVGNFVDGLYFPFSYLTFWEKGGLWAVDGLDKREKVLSQDKLIEDSLDSYQLVKHVYIQYEAFKFHENSTDMSEFIKDHEVKVNNVNDVSDDEELDDFMDEID